MPEGNTYDWERISGGGEVNEEKFWLRKGSRQDQEGLKVPQRKGDQPFNPDVWLHGLVKLENRNLVLIFPQVPVMVHNPIFAS